MDTSFPNIPPHAALTTWLEAPECLVFSCDVQGRLTYASPALLQRLGWPASVLPTRRLADFWPQPASTDCVAALQQVLQQGQPWTGALPLPDLAPPRSVTLDLRPLHGADGGLCGAAGVWRETTDWQAQVAALQEHNQLLDTILNNISSFIYLKDSERRYHYVNAVVAQAFEKPRAQVIGQRDLDLMGLDEAEYLWSQDVKVFETGQTDTREEEFLNPQGELRHFWTHSIPVELKNNLQALIGISTDVTELHQLKEELRRQANTDMLTGVSNRRHFAELAQREFARARRYHTPLTVLTLDIDFFKKINDTFGHPVGDVVLQAVARCCQATVRSEDILARLGGEEFAVLLPHTGLLDGQGKPLALALVERLREAVAALRLAGDWDGDIQLSVSLGMAELTAQDANFDALFARADKALYQAKQQGRNRVVQG